MNRVRKNSGYQARRGRRKRITVTGWLLGISLLLGLSGTLRADFRSDMLEAADTAKSGAYVRDRFLAQMKKPFTATGGRKLILVGDSHAQDFYNVIRETGALSPYQISTRYIPTVCQMYLGPEDVTPFRRAEAAAICRDADTLAQAKAQIAEADVVILAGNWRPWAAERLPQSIRNLGLRPQQQLIVLGRKSFGKPDIRRYLRMPEHELRTLRSRVDADQASISRLMRGQFSPAVYVDQQALLCGSETDCPVFTPELRLISFDGGHFTPQGAAYAGRILFSQPPLKGL
ncbi:MAG: hypothetical protein KDI44_18610 [Thiothrix sp.]|nr:hypothetical protein [Thiothrix sp.]HPQ96137.1 SGNH hydrolase domain-containing protein [Thiolinea sp.]